MQTGEREFHLGLNTRRAGNPASGGMRHKVVQQCRLSESGVATYQQRLAAAGAHISGQFVEDGALRPPAAELVRRHTPRHRATAT
jgi:hypothetical protein